MRPIYCYFFILSVTVVSCVSTGTYKALQVEKSKSDSLYTWAMASLKTSQGNNDRLVKEKSALKDSVNDFSLQLNAVKQNNMMLHKQLDDLSGISKAQAEIIRKSIDNSGVKDRYLQQLRTALSRRDSMNLAVLLELKAAFGSFSDTVVAIKVAHGVVGLTVANALLFGDDSSNVTVTDKGKNLLVRLGRVLRDQPDIGCRVETYSAGVLPSDSVSLGLTPPDSVSVGMTLDSVSAGMTRPSLDSVSLGMLRDSVRAGLLAGSVNAVNAGLPVGSEVDGWELRVRRAASVVSMLQNRYNVSGARLVAAGHGEAGSGTRIVLVPPGDQLSEVLEKK
jgi:chemotaxis protein MotB